MNAKKKLLLFIYKYKGNDWFTRTIKELLDECINETRAAVINELYSHRYKEENCEDDTMVFIYKSWFDKLKEQNNG